MLFTIAVLSMLSSMAASAVAPAEQGAVAAMNAPHQLEIGIEDKKRNLRSCAEAVADLQGLYKDLQLQLEVSQDKVFSQGRMLSQAEHLLEVSQAELVTQLELVAYVRVHQLDKPCLPGQARVCQAKLE